MALNPEGKNLFAWRSERSVLAPRLTMLPMIRAETPNLDAHGSLVRNFSERRPDSTGGTRRKNVLWSGGRKEEMSCFGRKERKSCDSTWSKGAEVRDKSCHGTNLLPKIGK